MRYKRWSLLASGLAVLCVVALNGCRGQWAAQEKPGPEPVTAVVHTSTDVHTSTVAERIVSAAKDQVRRGVVYDASYCVLPYPNGDVPADRGACTDVIVRSLRASGYDLQKLMHEDMTRHFALYPRRYGLARPDSNIDHRRVPNQIVFFRRFGQELPTATSGPAARSWLPGDFVYWKLPSGLDHCGVCSDERNTQGLPLIVHNLSRTAQEDVLTRWPMQGHFRFPKQSLMPASRHLRRSAPAVPRSRDGARSVRTAIVVRLARERTGA